MEGGWRVRMRVNLRVWGGGECGGDEGGRVGWGGEGGKVGWWIVRVPGKSEGSYPVLSLTLITTTLTLTLNSQS